MIEEVDPLHPVTRVKLLGSSKARDESTIGFPKDSFPLGRGDDPIDGLHLVVPEEQAGLPKRLSLDIGQHQRNFCFNILICAEGAYASPSADKNTRLRRYTPLAHARSDVHAMNRFVKGSVLLFHDLAFISGLRPGGGAFNEDVVVSKPTFDDLNKVAGLCREFFVANVDDPEWRGGQINVYFSGHGDMDRSTHDAVLVTNNDLLDTSRFVDFLEQCCSPVKGSTPWTYFHQSGLCKVNLHLDCCHAGAFAIDVCREIFKRRTTLLPGDFRAACLPHQKAREYPELGHGLYSYAYLKGNQCAFQSSSYDITEKDIGRSTGFLQIPLRIFSGKSEILVRLPGTNLAYQNINLFEKTYYKLLASFRNPSDGDLRYEVRDLFHQVSEWCKSTHS